MNETDSIAATTDEQPHSVQMTRPRLADSASESSRAEIRTRAVTPLTLSPHQAPSLA